MKGNLKYAMAQHFRFHPTHVTPRLVWALQRLSKTERQKLLNERRMLFGLMDSYLIWKLTGINSFSCCHTLGLTLRLDPRWGHPCNRSQQHFEHRSVGHVRHEVEHFRN